MRTVRKRRGKNGSNIVEQENEMMKKRTYDLREQQRLQLAEIQAQKETLRVIFSRGNKGSNFEQERAKLEKEKEKMRIDEQVMGQRYKQANEEHNKKVVYRE